MTGRRPAPVPGVQTLRRRQSSLIGPLPVSVSPISGTICRTGCGERGPKSMASRTPDQGCGFAGGMKRPGPAVEAPYGTPLNAFTPFRIGAAKLASRRIDDEIAAGIALCQHFPEPAADKRRRREGPRADAEKRTAIDVLHLALCSTGSVRAAVYILRTPDSADSE